jgi:uncharacterized LabA/DUF88 family protein
MNRVIFLIDGFNLYHSILDIKYHHPGLIVKWLNIQAFCHSFLHIINPTATLEKVYYFSAYAYHLADPGIIKRHQDYIKCLESTGIEPILSRFKPKHTFCSLCKRDFVKHEEKETDVAIATKLLEVLGQKQCETVVLVTGDTDIVPAVKTVNKQYPPNTVLFAFPFGRYSKELDKLAPKSFKIRVDSYTSNQFDNPVVLSSGNRIFKPATW